MSLLLQFRPTAVLAALVACLVFSAAARAADPATQPGDASAPIRALIPDLADRAKGAAAVEKLTALRDERVLHLFERFREKTVYQLGDRVVYVPSIHEVSATVGGSATKVADIYDVLAPVDANGKLIDAPEKTVPEREIKEFRLARPVRSAVIDALLVLGLKMDSPLIRAEAARDLGTKRQAGALAALRDVADHDPVEKVKSAAKESIALILVDSPEAAPTPDQKLKAAAELGEFNSIRSLDALHAQLQRLDPKSPAAAVYAKAISQIEWHQTITNWINNMFFGLSSGSIYVLLALGLAITFGLMGVINMAHGEMMMIGAVTTWACFEFISPHLPAAYFDWYYVIAFPLSFLTAAAVGLLIEVSVVRFLYKRPLDSLLATIGVSYVLIQAVRLWKGDNLGMQTPSWASNHIDIIQDVSLPYNRLFLIALTLFCILSVVALFRYTRLGLMIRATVQNREMAQSLGVNTRRVDMVTFAFGAGLAGLAGYGIVLTGSNPNPEMGQTFIVKSFLTVVIGGVGKLAGVVVSGLGLGFIEKTLEPIVIISHPLRIFDSTWAQVASLLIVVAFMQRKPAGLFPDKGRMADQADKISAPPQTKITFRGDLILGGLLALIGLVIVPALYGTGAIRPEFVNQLGYFSTFAICALGLDLIWGYIGVLSLCQFMFFAMGAYCMGIYLINHGPHTSDGIPECLSIVMSAVTNRTPPWFLPLFNSFPVAMLLGVLLPGLLALLIGVTTFRSRVKGVYFSILTQAFTVMAVLIFQKNDLKLGGTNGLGNFSTILGYPIARDLSVGLFGQTRFWLYIISVVTLLVAIVIAKLMTNSGFGRVLVAIRDDETRLRFVGYQTWAYKATAFTIAAVFAAIGGMLYVPQQGAITPGEMVPFRSILVVAWVAVGGRGSLWGAVIGTFFVSLLYNYVTTAAPDYWYFMLGGLFICVPLMLPGGIMSLPATIRKLTQKRASSATEFDMISTLIAEAP